MTAVQHTGPGGERRAVAPLAGVRVADFTFQGAGAYATTLVAALGADVYKIESSLRPDPTRGRENRPYLHSLLYDDVNQGKRSVSINMKDPEGVELAVRLIDRCDAAVDNFRPGVMEGWGLTWDFLSRRNPRLVMASLSAVGRSGPLSRLPGYAGIFNAFSGLGDLTGYRGGPPTELRTSIDMRAGAGFAFAIVQALTASRRHSLGARVDYSAAESITGLIGDYVTARAHGGAVPARCGSEDEQFQLQGMFRTRDARWLCVCVRDDADWRALETQTGLGEGQLADRRELLGEWAGGVVSSEAEEVLVAASVPFAFALDARGLAENEHLQARGYFVETPAAEGDRPRVLAAAPWTFAGHRPQVAPGPELGQDTAAVLREVLDLTGDEVDRLIEKGVCR